MGRRKRHNNVEAFRLDTPYRRISRRRAGAGDPLIYASFARVGRYESVSFRKFEIITVDGRPTGRRSMRTVDAGWVNLVLMEPTICLCRR